MSKADELTAYLEPLAQSGKRLSKEEQLTFRRDCLRLLNELCGPSAYLDKVRRRFSLEQEDYPGMKVLNLVFEDARIPYRIRNARIHRILLADYVRHLQVFPQGDDAPTQTVTAAMYSTRWQCPTAVRLCRSYLARPTEPIFRIWENLQIEKETGGIEKGKE